MKSNLADLMAHKGSTAQRFYRLQEKQEACLQAATNLPSITRISETKKDKSADDAIQDDVIPEIDDNSPYTKAEGSTERISWKEAEVKILREVFAQNIRSKSVTMAIVTQTIQGILPSSQWTRKWFATGSAASGSSTTMTVAQTL